jgi:hypothetical protein
MLTVYCPICSQKLRAPEGSTGLKAKCANCGHTFIISSATSIDEPSLESTSAPRNGALIDSDAPTESLHWHRSRRSRRPSFRIIVCLLLLTGLCGFGITVAVVRGKNDAANRKSREDEVRAARIEAVKAQQQLKERAAAEAARLREEQAETARRNAEAASLALSVEASVLDARRYLSVLEGREAEFDRTLRREIASAQNAVMRITEDVDRANAAKKFANDQSLEVARERLRLLQDNSDRGARRRDDVAVRMKHLEEERLDEYTRTVALLPPDHRQRVIAIGNKVAPGQQMSEFDALTLAAVGLGDVGKAREFFLGSVTDADIAALTSLGENAVPKVEASFAVAKIDFEATVDAARRFVASDQVHNRHDGEELQSRLQERFKLLQAADDLLRDAKERFERVKLRLGQLSRGERVAVTKVGNQLARNGKLEEGEARVLVHFGFGEEVATKALKDVIKSQSKVLNDLGTGVNRKNASP